MGRCAKDGPGMLAPLSPARKMIRAPSRNHSKEGEIPKMLTKAFVVATLLSAVSYLCAVPAFAQSSQETGKLKIHVNPKQAYVFVDGKAIRDGSQIIELAAGDHKVGVYNYGYMSKTQGVHVGACETTDFRRTLQSSGGGRS